MTSENILLDQAAPKRASPNFGRYRLIASLGHGATAQLHIAEQTGIEGFSRIVTLKRILPHIAALPNFRRIFFHDAKVVAGLEHPNIASVFELGEIDGSYFISLEYLAGEDLAQILATCKKRSSPMPIEFALAIAQECAGALHFAHELSGSDGASLGVVHRDITPTNIMVTSHGVSKLLDFGLTKVRPAVRSPYVAPEQTSGQPIDLRADLYSLGAVLWECLTGERPPVQHEAPPPSQLRPETAVELDQIVRKAMAYAPKDRFQSALELSDQIDRLFALQYDRVSPTAVGRWLEDLFGTERISAKRALAQGHNVDQALAVLARGPTSEPALPQEKGRSSRHTMRSAWSTDQAGGYSVHSQTTIQTLTPTTSMDLPLSITESMVNQLTRLPVQEPTSDVALLSNITADLSGGVSRAGGIAVTIFALVILGGALVLGFVTNSSPPENSTRQIEGALEVSSEPPGALIFLDGEPTGQTTPAKITGLKVNDPLELRLDKPGMAQVRENVSIEAGKILVKRFELVPEGGLVRFTSVPRSTMVFIDDRRIDASAPVLLSAGAHKLRLENSRDVLFERAIEVKLGDQEIDLGAGGP